MRLELDTFDEVERGLQFLQLERKRLGVRAKLTFGPVEDQEPDDSANIPLTLQRYICKETCMALMLKATQKVSASVAFTDSKGNPTTDVENVTWGAGNNTLLTVTPDPVDSFKATVVPVGPIADLVQVNVQGDAKVGAGEEIVAAVGDIQIIAGQAAVATVNFGTPEDQ